MAEDILNFDDPLIRAMVDRDHVPMQEFVGRGFIVKCYSCGQEWPCPTRIEFRKLEANNG